MSDFEPWVPEPSKSKTDSEQEEIVKLAASIPVIEEVIDWFESRIEAYKGVGIIEGANPTSKAEDIKSAVLLAKTMQAELKSELNNLRVAFSEYIKEDADAA